MVLEDQSSYSLCIFQQFHSNHGNLVQLSEDRLSAFRLRPSHEFNQGLVFSSLPLRNDEVFEVRIDRKVHSWTGSLQIGVTTNDPTSLKPAPPNALDIAKKSWILSGCNLFENGKIIVEDYGPDLDELNEGDRVGIMRTSEGDLVLYVNSFAQGVAVTGLPESVYACVDLYGKCVQITAVVNNDTKNASSRPQLTLNTAVISNNTGLITSVHNNQEEEDRVSAATSCVSTPGSPISIGTVDRLRFHHRCGTMVKLSAGQRTGERRRPLDEFNNAVVMTQRPLLQDELFEIRIDSLVDKWSGSIEVGITTHNPQALDFPSTMTNLRSGTIMMSGCGILTNGKGTRREYGQCNLDELAVGDRIGLVLYANGELHFFVNSRDQGVAASNVPHPVWGVVDLYGRTVKVSLVDREDVTNKPPSEIAERPEGESDQDLMTMTSSAMSTTSVLAQDRISQQDPLLFYPRCGAHAAVVNAGMTAHRPNAQSDFNHGVVLTNRPLKADELFEVMLDRMVLKWAGSIEIGVTTQQPEELDFPATMTNIRSGTWMMTGNGVMHNGLTVLDDYGTNLDRLGSGDRVGVKRLSNGALHFYVNGVDQGAVTAHVPERVYGVVDLYGQAAQVTIVDHSSATSLTESLSPYPSYLYPAPATLAPLVSPSSLVDSTYAMPSSSISSSNSSSSTLIHMDLSFHRLHGINTTLNNNNLTAFRPNALSEFNNAICVTSRPLHNGEMFEVVIEKLVERWSGSLELGVTAISPENLDFPATMTDIDYETWMLSGSTVMQVGGDGTITRNGYPLDLDALQEGNRVGVLRHADGSLHYYLNSQDQGPACWNVPAEIYAVIDLYGQCAQVSLVHRPLMPMANTPNNPTNDLTPREVLSNTKTSSVIHHHRLSPHHGRAITLLDNGKAARRDDKDFENGLVFSAEPLHPGETFEVRIESVSRRWSGSISIGLTNYQPRTDSSNPVPVRIHNLQDSVWYISGTDSMLIHQTLIGKVPEQKAILWPSLAILEHLQVGDCISVSHQSSSLRFFVNGRDLMIPNIKPNVPLSGCYVVFELYGAIQSASVKSLAIVAPTVPESMVPNPAQNDGLPLSLSQLALREAVQGIQSALSTRFGAVFSAQQQLQQQRFHGHHGRNVLLKDNGKTALRTDSYNQGLVFSKDPLVSGSQPFQIRIEQLDERWTGSIMLGVTAISPEKMSSAPTCALLLKRPSWIISGRCLYQGIGRRLTNNIGFDLNKLKAGQTAGVYINSTGHLCVVLEGQDRGPVAKVGLDQGFYAVVDLYGACLQASVVLPGQPASDLSPVVQSVQPILTEEKALRESANSEKILRASRSPKRRSCCYKSSCVRFIRLIGLPEAYLDTESFFCGCQHCFDESSNGSSTDKIISELKGWCRWKVKKRTQMEAVSTGALLTKKEVGGSGCNEKWQIAYHATKPAVVRRILDEGHLLPPDLNIWQRTRVARNKSDKGHDGDSDGQMLFFSPSIQQSSSTPSSEIFDPLTKKIQRGHVILQVLVQPGSYKVRRATSPQNGPVPTATVTAINITAPVGPAVVGSTNAGDQVSTTNSPVLPSSGAVLSAPTSAIGAADESNILWYTKERGAAVVQSLLIRTEDDRMIPS